MVNNKGCWMMQLCATIIISLIGVHITYWLAHKKKMNRVRAASLTSLIFIGLANLSGSALLLSLQPALFGSTFVAMSEPHRLSERKVLFAGFMFGCILFLLQQANFVHYHGGVGGTLGGAAFIACLLVYWLQWIFLAVGGELKTKA